MKISVFHLYNDFSGSPKVLCTLLNGLASKGYGITLHTSSGGPLDRLAELPGVRIRHYSYRFHGQSLRTALAYLRVQTFTFFSAFRSLLEKDIFYINTILPLGGALAGRLMGKRVVYHYHENPDSRGRLYKWLAKGMERLASDIICVSENQKRTLGRSRRVHVVPNPVPDDFLSRLTPNPEEAFGRKRILMVCSLKAYKGIPEFVRLAERCPQYSFHLVIGETMERIGRFFSGYSIELPPNVSLHPRNANLAPIYNQASVVVNLSNPKMFKESFGMALLEGMSAGLPVLLPRDGGLADRITDGREGFKIDPGNLEEVEEALARLLDDRKRYLEMSEAARSFALRHNESEFLKNIITILESGNPGTGN